MFDNQLSEKYRRKRRERFIGSATAAAFWTFAILAASGAVFKAATTDSGRQQLANLFGQDTVIAVLGDQPSKLEELKRQVFAQTRYQNNRYDSIQTGSINPDTGKPKHILSPIDPQQPPLMTGSLRDTSANTMPSPESQYIVELANSQEIAPLRDTLYALKASNPTIMQRGFPNIRRHITADYPDGRYFLYLQKFDDLNHAYQTCSEYMRSGIPCATTAVLSQIRQTPVIR